MRVQRGQTFNIHYGVLLRVKLRIYSVRFTEQINAEKKERSRVARMNSEHLQRVHSLKTKRLSVNRSTAVSYTHLDVYKRQVSSYELKDTGRRGITGNISNVSETELFLILKTIVFCE